MRAPLKSKSIDQVVQFIKIPHSVLLTAAVSVAICCVSSAIAYSQSRKDLKKSGITESKEVMYSYCGGKEYVWTQSELKYDKDGNVIEEVTYNSDGSIRKKQVRVYHDSGKLMEEANFGAQGFLEDRVAYTFDEDGEKLSEKRYFPCGALMEWVKFGVDDKGQRISESYYDEQGKLLRKSVFTYDSKGFRKEKKNYSADDKLLSVKKYDYSK